MHFHFLLYPGIHHISDGVFLSSAEALADMVTEEDLAVGRSKSFKNKQANATQQQNTTNNQTQETN